MSDGSGVRVFFYGDYACPFSYIADERLSRLERERDLRIAWRPLPIHGTVPPEGIRRTELGMPPGEAAELRREVEKMADALGLPLAWPERVVNSYEALQVAEFARDLGDDVFRHVHERLFRAYFAEGRNLGRREELLSVVVDGGLDREAVEGALEDGRYEEEIRRSEREAERYDLEETPTMLFGRYKVVGAAPVQVMREAVTRAAEEPDRSPDASTGAEADPDREG